MIRRTRRRRLVLRSTLFLLSFVLSLGIGEFALRRITTGYDKENFSVDRGLYATDCFAPSLTRGYAPIPGFCGLNSEGAQVVAGKTPQAKRLMLLGDSIATLPVWVQSMHLGLEAALPQEGVAIHNYAVPGYNTCQEASTFADQVDALEPDLILLQSCSNDAIGSPVLVRTGGRARFFADGDVVDFPVWFLHSRLLTLVGLTVGNRTEMSGANLAQGYVHQCLLDLRDGAAARGIPLVSVLFPVLWDSDQAATGGQHREEAFMRAAQVQAGIPLVDLRPVLEAAGPLETFRRGGFDDIHPNDTAQALAGPAVASALLPYFAAP